MKEYTIIYKDDTTEHVEVADKSELIKTHFHGDEDLFKKEVSRLMWTTLTTQYILDVQTGETTSEIFTADQNPYGWRQGESGGPGKVNEP